MITVVVSFTSYWFIDDFPESSKFLTAQERTHIHRATYNFVFMSLGDYLLESLKADGQMFVSKEPFNFKRVRRSFSDLKVWVASAYIHLLRSVS